MDAMNFGDVLRQAREHSGEDIVSVARRIRIRPDILERIEASDLDGMPPRGYSRNMINAYARYLGLNPTEIVKMYLDAQYRHQVEKARESIKPTGFDMSAGRRRGHNRETVSASETRAHLASGSSYSTRRGASDASDDFFGPSPTSTPPAATTRRIGAVHVGSYNAYGQGLSQRSAARSASETRVMDPIDDRHGGRSTHRARRSALPEEHYGNLYAAPSNLGVRNGSSFLREKLPFVVAGVVILLLVVVIVVMVNGMNRAATTEPSTQPINIDVTGMPGSEDAQQDSSDDASSGDGAQQDAQTAQPAVEVAPTKTTMTLEVADDATSYIEVYLDGQIQSDCYGDITGPASYTFDVTGTFELRCVPADGVSLKQDGADVALTPNEGGIVVVDVNFQDVLNAWNAEHASTSSAGASSDAAAAASGDAAASTE